MTPPPAVIYCDFDGTVTQRDVVDMLLERLADPAWRALEAEWEEGRIGSHECMARQVPLLRGGWPAITHVLRDVQLDPTFKPFAAWCATRDIPLYIVSDGMDRVIEFLLARAGITVNALYANRLVVAADGALSLAFPFPSRAPDCRSGVCKCERLAASAGVPRVVIGDGRSDFCVAHHADRLFAKSPSALLRYCQAQELPCAAFTDFHDIQRALEHVLKHPTRSRRLLVGASEGTLEG